MTRVKKKVKRIKEITLARYVTCFFCLVSCVLTPKSNTGISFHGVVQNILFFWFELMVLLNRKCPSIKMKEYQLFKIFN